MPPKSRLVQSCEEERTAILGHEVLGKAALQLDRCILEVINTGCVASLQMKRMKRYG